MSALSSEDNALAVRSLILFLIFLVVGLETLYLDRINEAVLRIDLILEGDGVLRPDQPTDGLTFSVVAPCLGYPLTLEIFFFQQVPIEMGS